MQIYNAKLNSEYYPNVIRDIPLDMPIRYTLLELVILEKKCGKKRGEHFNTTALQLARICACSEKQMRGYLQKLKRMKLVDWEQCGHLTYYAINWDTISRFLNVEHIMKK